MNVIIVGSPLTGTSLIMRILNKAGFGIAPKRDLIGSFENRHMDAFNNSILQWYNIRAHVPESVKSWRDMHPSFSSYSIPQEAEPHFEKFVHSMSGKAPWVNKGSKTSLTLPIWVERLPNTKVIWCIRHPDEVALSHQMMAHRMHEKGFSSSAWMLPSSTIKMKLYHFNEYLREYTEYNMQLPFYLLDYGRWETDFENLTDELAFFLGISIYKAAKRMHSLDEIESGLPEIKNDFHLQHYHFLQSIKPRLGI